MNRWQTEQECRMEQQRTEDRCTVCYREWQCEWVSNHIWTTAISVQPFRKPLGQILKTQEEEWMSLLVSMLSMLAWEQGSTEAPQSSRDGWLPFRGCKEIFFLVPGYNMYCFSTLSLTLEDCSCCSKITKETPSQNEETAGAVTLGLLECPLPSTLPLIFFLSCSTGMVKFYQSTW